MSWAEPLRWVIVALAAAEAAAALGARVTVLARCESSRAAYHRRAPDGVRVLVNIREALLDCLADADLVIGAILVSTWDTPAMITEADLRLMRVGAVIVDATCGYGATCVLILAESHITVSTWPEHQLAHIDVFTCRADTRPSRAIQPILDQLAGQVTHTQNVPRTPPGSLLPLEGLDERPA